MSQLNLVIPLIIFLVFAKRSIYTAVISFFVISVLTSIFLYKNPIHIFLIIIINMIISLFLLITCKKEPKLKEKE